MKVESMRGETVGWGYFAAALILTVAVRLYLFRETYIINSDGIVYIDLAKHFWSGRWLDGLAGFYPPLFPLMIAAVYPLAGEWELAGRLWPLVLGALVLFPLWGFLRRIYNPETAHVALFFYALSPYPARLSVDVRSEIPYIFFLLSGLYFFQRALDRKGGLVSFLAGISTGLAYLARPEAIGVLAIGALFLLYRGWLKGAMQKMWMSLGLFVLGFLVLAAPYILYLKGDTGKWLLSRKAGNAVSQGLSVHDRNVAVVSQEESVQAHPMDLVRAHPFAYAKKVFVDFFRFFGFYLEAMHYAYLPFLFLGWLVFLRGNFWRKREWLLFVLVAFYCAAFPLVYVTRRYSVPLVPVSLGWVATGFLIFWQYAYLQWPRRGTVFVGLLAVLAVLGTIPKTLASVSREKLYLREAGEYLKDKPGDPLILMQDSRVAFYAGGLKSGIEQALDAKVVQGTYLIFDSHLPKPLKAALRARGWAVEREFRGPKGEGVVIALLKNRIHPVRE